MQPPAICFPKGKQTESTGQQLEAFTAGAGKVQTQCASPRLVDGCLLPPLASPAIWSTGLILLGALGVLNALWGVPMWKGRLVRVARGSVPCLAIQLQIGNNAANWWFKGLIKSLGMFYMAYTELCLKKKKKCWLLKMSTFHINIHLARFGSTRPHFYGASVSYLELGSSTSFWWGVHSEELVPTFGVCICHCNYLCSYLVLESFWYEEEEETPGNDFPVVLHWLSSSVEIQSLGWPTKIVQRSFNPIQGMDLRRRLATLTPYHKSRLQHFKGAFQITYHTSCLHLIRWFSSSHMVDR